MADSENLIRSVKKYKPIWDLEDQGYHNKALKDEAWDGVGQDLIRDWNVLSKGEKYIRLLELKRKWNNIRDYYKKLTERPGEIVRAKKRRYLYSHLLDFMRPVYDKRRYHESTPDSDDFSIDGGSSGSSANPTRDRDEPERESMNNVQETEPVADFPTKKTPVLKRAHKKPKPQDRRASKPVVKIKKKNSLSVFERTVLKSLESKSSLQDEDPDFLFLKSLLPDIKAMTSSQKLDFKLGVMELYRNIINRKDQSALCDQDFDVGSLTDNIKVETIRLSAEDDNYET